MYKRQIAGAQWNEFGGEDKERLLRNYDLDQSSFRAGVRTGQLRLRAHSSAAVPDSQPTEETLNLPRSLVERHSQYMIAYLQGYRYERPLNPCEAEVAMQTQLQHPTVDRPIEAPYPPRSPAENVPCVEENPLSSLDLAMRLEQMAEFPDRVRDERVYIHRTVKKSGSNCA